MGSAAMSYRRLLASIALCAVGHAAEAVTVVNLCASDRQAPTSPSQRNLQAALVIGGEIQFSCPQGTVLRITGEHSINGNTTIDGGSRVTLDAQGRNLFRADWAGATLTLRNIRLQNGGQVLGRAAMIWGVMETVLENVDIVGTNHAIQIEGNGIRVTNSRFADNTGPVLMAQRMSVSDSSFVRTTYHAMYVESNTPGSEVFLDKVIVEGNANGNDSPSRFHGCNLTVTRSTFRRHVASAGVGGALVVDCPKATIVDTVFEDNTAISAGALALGNYAREVEIRSATFSRNSATSFGGAISANHFPDAARSLTILRSRFVQNRATRGGAIMLEGTRLRGSAVSFKANTASDAGGAIYASYSFVQLGRTLFVDNEAPTGASLRMAGDAEQRLDLANTIIARSKGAGSALEGDLAGKIVTSTVTANEGLGIKTSQRLTLAGSIISHNRAGNCAEAGGRFVDGGGNLQFPEATCGSSAAVANPLLDSFFVPDFESPAQRAFDSSVCESPPTNAKDFYGQRRPRAPGARCTAGAVEGDIEQVIRRTKRHLREP